MSQIIDARLTAEQDAPPKQRRTAKRIFDRLVDEYGYGGKERAVRENVHERRLCTFRVSPSALFLSPYRETGT